MRDRRGTVAALVGGIAALVIGIVAASNEAFLEAIVSPPAFVRAVLIALSVVGGVALLAAAAARISAAGDSDNPERDLPGMIRGVRLIFLAVAAFAAAAGWALAHPLPLVVALVIAAIDVIETSFLLLVVTVRGDEQIGALIRQAHRRATARTWSQVGSPACAPGTSVDRAAATLAARSASGTLAFAARSSAKHATNASPAPVVSTGVTG